MAHYPRIRVHDNEGLQLIRESLCLRLYMRRRHSEIAPMVRHMLGRFTELAGSSLGRYFDDSDESYRKLDNRGWGKIFREINRQDKASVVITNASRTDCRYEFRYVGGAGPVSSEPPVEMCALYCFLPTEYLEEHGPDSLVELALHLIGPLPISSGNLGLTFYYLWSEDVVAQMKELGARHPGIELVKTLDATTEQGDRVNGISWLTFLGQPLLSEVGGAAELRTRLKSPTTTVQELDGDRVSVSALFDGAVGVLSEVFPVSVSRRA